MERYDPFITLSSRPYEALVDVPFRVMAMDLKWSTRKEAEDSITVLLQYMGRASNEYWRFVRAWRTMNVLQSALPGADETATRVIRSTLKAVERDYNKYIWVQP